MWQVVAGQGWHAVGVGCRVDGKRGSKWHIADLRPGSEPIANLACALLGCGVLGDLRADDAEAAAQVAAVLGRGPLGVVELLRQRQLPRYANLLILVDQFEEMFRFQQHGDANEALAFVNLLLATSSQPNLSAYVMLTLRSDFLGNCAVFPGLPEALNDGQFLCPRLTRDQCREAIEGPASVFAAEVDGQLVNRILNDIGSDPDQLPVMQHALMRVWNLAKEKAANTPANPSVRLLLADYESESVGGLRHALSRHADEAYQDVVKAGHGRLAETLFRNLSQRGADGQDMRRPVSVTEVARVAGVREEDVIQVVEAFRRADRCFLTPPADMRLDAHSVIDVSHESLIRQWDRMRNWVQCEADSAEKYRRLVQSSLLEAKGAGGLLHGLELKDVSDWRNSEKPTAAWAERYQPGSFHKAMQFLDRSLEEQQRQRAAQAERERQERERERRELASAQRRAKEQAAAAKLFRRMTIVLGVVSAAAVILLFWAVNERNRAQSPEETRNHGHTKRSRRDHGRGGWRRVVSKFQRV